MAVGVRANESYRRGSDSDCRCVVTVLVLKTDEGGINARKVTRGCGKFSP